ncbi:uncharacterized protein LOC111710741, partial [Eurytemora carolleeae]|uniref:uncharacterized protein LOC111710741 n=1 Tax=Eurytemora carolleeae TaxID=1294199 RepID=UPI000C78E66C
MKKMQRRSKTDKDGKPVEKEGKKEKEGLAGDGDSYCDSEASLDESCYDNLEEPLSPPQDLQPPLDIRHHEEENLRLNTHPVSSHFLQPNPIDKLYLMQDSYF